MKIIIETERLIIREIHSTDIDEMLQLHSDPDVHRYLGNKTISSREKMVDVIHWLSQQYHDFGVGRWAIRSNVFECLNRLELVIVLKHQASCFCCLLAL